MVQYSVHSLVERILHEFKGVIDKSVDDSLSGRYSGRKIHGTWRVVGREHLKHRRACTLKEEVTTRQKKGKDHVPQQHLLEQFPKVCSIE